MDRPGNQIRPYALKVGEGWTYRFGIDFIVKAGEVQEGSGAAFLEYISRQGEEPDDHTHPTEDEMFYVLEGAITFRCGDETFDLEQGGLIFLPRGIRPGSPAADCHHRSGQGWVKRRVGRLRGRHGVRTG